MEIKFEKKFLFYSIFILMQFIATICLGEELKLTINNDVVIFNNIKVENKKNLFVSGIDVSKYGFEEIYGYAINRENELYIIGKKEKEYELLFMLINLIDNKKNTIIVQERLFGKQPIAVMKFIIYEIWEKKSRQSFVILIYHEDLSGNRTDFETTTMEIFRQEKNNEFTKILKEQIEEANICYSESFTTYEDGYYAYICKADDDDLEKYSPDNKPARKIINRIFLSDVNVDGYQDILVWRRIETAKLKKETNDRQDYAFNSERLYVMYFDPETKAFKNRVPFDWD